MENTTLKIKRILVNNFTDNEWLEYFNVICKSRELSKTGSLLSNWEELKKKTINDIKLGLAIYAVMENGGSGYFILNSIEKDNTKKRYTYISHYFRKRKIDLKLIKRIFNEVLKFDSNTNYLAFPSRNGEHNYIKNMLTLETNTSQNHYELLKEEVNIKIIENWIKRAKTMFPKYRLVFYETLPETLLSDYSNLFTELLLDMPKNSEFRNPYVTSEMIRKRQIKEEKNNCTSYRYLLFNERNKMIGKTNIFIDKNNTKYVHQYMTGVTEKYRSKGLSKWLKAEMLKKIINDFPKMESIITETHPENTALIALNKKLGYNQVATLKEFKIPLERLKNI